MNQQIAREREIAHAFFMPRLGVAGSSRAPVLPQGSRETGGAFSFSLFLFLLILSFCQPAGAAVRAGMASWYSSQDACPYNPDPRCPMANGRSIYEQEQTQPYFAASWDYPFGTILTVCHTYTHHCINTVVSDRGPSYVLHKQGRILDLSQAAFQALAPLAQGLVEVTVELVR